MRATKAAIVAVVAVLLAGAAQAQETAPAPQGPGGDVIFFRHMQGPGQMGGPEQPMHPHGDLGKLWKNSEIVQKLQLTQAQINQLEQVFLDQRLKLIDLRADVEREEARLQPLVEADKIDEPKALAQIDAVLAARGKLEKQNAMLMFSIRCVLSVEQWKKLQALQQERERMWFERRPALAPMPPEPPSPPRPPDQEN
jgi:Spy/CpxP family protein refolding chaperone